MQGESRFFGMRTSKVNLVFLVIACLLVHCSLGDLVLLVVMWLTLPPRLTLNMNLESMSITIMLKGKGGGGVKLKHNTLLELYIISSRNTCDPRLLDVPFARKRARFTRLSETSSSASKIHDLECSTPP